MIRMAVMYPNSEGVNFDLDYYRTTHMALVREKFGSLGLEGIEIDSGVAGATGAAPFVAIGYLLFPDMAALQNALKTAGGEVMKDVPNFTNAEPQIQISEMERC